jgi:hypothetical protein
MAEFPQETKKSDNCNNCYHRDKIGAGPFCKYHAMMEIRLNWVCDHWKESIHK